MKRVALVTGANRGIGFEICRQLAEIGMEVILTSRDAGKGQMAVENLAKEGLVVHHHELDVKNFSDIQRVVGQIERKFGRIDVLVNNAGILPDKAEHPTSPEQFLEAFQTNSMGPFFLCQAVLASMKKNKYGRIVNISSGMGQLSEMESGWPAYRLSKTALNAVTRIIAAEGADASEFSHVKVNSMCPGWVKTDMGGPSAEKTLEEGADTAVWLSTLPDDGPSGGFFRERKPIAW